MQDSPSKLQLLRSVSAFLKHELRPLLDDKGLQFRALIAANLVRIVADELKQEDDDDALEFQALLTLLSQASHPTALQGEARKEAITALRQTLARQIRQGELVDKEATFRFLKDNLKTKLSVVNPRFSTELEIE